MSNPTKEFISSYQKFLQKNKKEVKKDYKKLEKKGVIKSKKRGVLHEKKRTNFWF